MKKAAIALLAVMAIGSGCGKKLRPDPALPVIDARYPSLEIHVGEKVFNGVAVLSVPRGTNLRSLGVAFQGYYQGSYRFSSQRCELDTTGSFYEKNARVPIPVGGSAKEDCIVTITMSPEYPESARRGVEIDSFRGQIIIKVTDGEAWYGDSFKVTGDWRKSIKVFVGGEGEARILADGCGKEYDQVHTIKDGFVELELSQATAIKEPCVLDGAIVTEEFEDYLFTVYVAQYLTEKAGRPFSPLPFPVVKEDGDEIEVIGDGVVSVLSLDQEFEIDFKAKFDFDPKKPHILRAATVMGRLALGVYKPGEGWRWLQ